MRSLDGWRNAGAAKLFPSDLESSESTSDAFDAMRRIEFD